MNIFLAGHHGAIGEAINSKLHAHHQLDFLYADVRKFFIAKYDEIKYDAMIYNIGINHLEWSYKLLDDEFIDTFNVNVTGLLRCLRYIHAKRVVVIGSDAAHRPMRTSAAYNASKAALEATVKCIARERAADGFIINIVAPGVIEGTKMTEYVANRTAELRPGFDLDKYQLSNIPMGRLGRPDEVAEVVRWLVEDAPDYLNGSTITINGAR